jgi:hypothetical protein
MLARSKLEQLGFCSSPPLRTVRPLNWGNDAKGLTNRECRVTTSSGEIKLAYLWSIQNPESLFYLIPIFNF